MARSKNFCFTHNNYENTDLQDKLECQYIVYGKEVGDSGTPHLQGFVRFLSEKSLKQVIKALPGCHCEQARDLDASIKYCQKEGDFTERGTKPKTQKQKGDANSERWAQALVSYKAGRFDEIPPDIGIRYGAGLEAWAAKTTPIVFYESETEHEWVYGPPGTGKSYLARSENAEEGFYIKDPTTTWWTGYKDEPVVIIDDFDKYQKGQGGDMKRWLDRYPFQARIHGSQKPIRPRKVIITSNYHPMDIWDDEVTCKAILRRVKLIHRVLPFKPNQPNPPKEAPPAEGVRNKRSAHHEEDSEKKPRYQFEPPTARTF